VIVRPRLAAVVLVAIALAPLPARADAFVFSDLDGFEKCMQLDHLVETVKTAGGEQTRLLRPPEIQARCATAGVKVVVDAKNKDLAMSFVLSAKRLGSWPNALALVDPLEDLSRPACNEMAVYEVIMEGLDLEDEHSPELKQSRSIVKRCLKDAQFKTDFLDEQVSENPHRAAHACQILTEEKLVKTCKTRKK